jgi:hypothetical protein
MGKVSSSATRSIEDALVELNRLIDLGVEYPDAQWKVCERFGVDGDKLQVAYDTQQRG